MNATATPRAIDPASQAATVAVATDSAPEAGAARRVLQAAVRPATEANFRTIRPARPRRTSSTRERIHGNPERQSSQHVRDFQQPQPAIRHAVTDVDPQLPVSYEMSFDDIVRETFARPREAAWLIGAFALLAFTLAAVGVYGVMAYATTERTREIAIRVALGASCADIVSLVVRQAMKL